jgi:hypothetical protein
MKTAQRSRNQFCACGHNRSLTYMGKPHVCGVLSCECVRHDTAKADAPTKVVDTKAIDSDLIDRVLMAETILHLEKRIELATQATQACLSAAKAGAPRTASRYAERALKALGSLGAS